MRGCLPKGHYRRTILHVRAYYFTGAQWAYQNLRKKRLKISRFLELNDPFELFAVEQHDPALRRRMKDWAKRVHAEDLRLLSSPRVVARILPICPRADAKLGAESMIEIRHVSEAGIQCNVEHARGFQHQSRRRPAQPSAEDILVGRKPGELLKNPNEMVAAKFRLSGKRTEPVARIRMTFDHANDSCNARLRSWQAPRVWLAATREIERSHGQFDTDLLPHCHISIRTARVFQGISRRFLCLHRECALPAARCRITAFSEADTRSRNKR